MKKDYLLLEKSRLKSNTSIRVPASKSESNRCLILDALAGKGSKLDNLSSSNDTKILIKALSNKRSKVIDVKDAGTCMRFLTAFYCITGQKITLKGTERMHKRPIGVLVEALRSLGADISYLGKSGYPPLEFKGFTQSSNTIFVAGNISSQFISALMMVGPLLSGGLTIHLKGKIISRPYIELTGKLMKRFGVNVTFKGRIIRIPTGKYKPTKLRIDGDWTGASYWYSLFALSGTSEMSLKGLSHSPIQGDASIKSLMVNYGVKTQKQSEGYILKKIPRKSSFDFDFVNNPDIAQTLIVLSAALKMKGRFKGLETLRIKETDRINALSVELEKIGVKLIHKSQNSFALQFGGNSVKGRLKITTYEDHRMAMAFAPLCMLWPLQISQPQVVSKSYPDFWKDMQSVLKPGSL